MIVISASNISKMYGTDIIIDDVSFNVNKGDHIGVVGGNGAGKTTLLEIIAGNIESSSGSVYVNNEIEIGYLKQKNIFNDDGTVMSEASRSFEKIKKIEEEIEQLSVRIDSATIPDDNLLNRYTFVMEEFERCGGYTYQNEIASILRNMGFIGEDFNKKISKLSGGEKTRLALSCILLRKPDILILDEPTNHLDLGMLSWLETYLKAYKGTTIIVSHDRYFLDNTVNRIFDISNNTLSAYDGNYSTFLLKKRERIESIRREYEKQQREIAKQEEIIRRFKQHNTEHLVKRAKSREKRLSHITTIENPVQKTANINVKFNMAYKSGNDVIIAEDINKAFGNKKLFDSVSLHIRKGEKICLIGENGTGKTTLLKILTGKEKYDSGYLKIGYNVNFAYYDQEQKFLNGSNNVLEEMKNDYHLFTDTEMRSILGRFLFRGDDVFKKINELSGGEKARLSLLKLMLSGANTLVLDEPTNHLDIESKEIVEDAIMEFEGTVIIVSHDRYLLHKVPDRILELKSDGIDEYKGNFEYYLEKKSNCSKQEEAEEVLEVTTDAAEERKIKKQAEMLERKNKRESEEIEDRIHEIEVRIADIEREISEGDKNSDIDFVLEKSNLMAEYEKEMSNLYERWMEIQS